MIYVMHAATDYNDFRKNVVDRFRDEHSVNTKVKRVFNKETIRSDEEKLKKQADVEKLMNDLLRK